MSSFEGGIFFRAQTNGRTIPTLFPLSLAFTMGCAAAAYHKSDSCSPFEGQLEKDGVRLVASNYIM